MDTAENCRQKIPPEGTNASYVKQTSVKLTTGQVGYVNKVAKTVEEAATKQRDAVNKVSLTTQVAAKRQQRKRKSYESES